MNLSRRARAVAIPSLEIDQPDCRRAAHSSSVGPIDETQLFYLESRGIPPDEARKFIVLGFLEPVVARVPLGLRPGSAPRAARGEVGRLVDGRRGSRPAFRGVIHRPAAADDPARIRQRRRDPPGRPPRRSTRCRTGR